MRHRGKRYNRRGRDGAGRGVIPGRVDISERPAEVDRKQRCGDWELDTVLGAKGCGALVSAVDRVTKYVYFVRVRRRTSKLVTEALANCLGPVQGLVLTLTADNGKEFAGHLDLTERLGAPVYFARPYHSWERGLNEHTNGLVRQYFPKGTDFRAVRDADVQKAQDELNRRPRRELSYRTPEEAFGAALKRAGCPVPWERGPEHPSTG